LFLLFFLIFLLYVYSSFIIIIKNLFLSKVFDKVFFSIYTFKKRSKSKFSDYDDAHLKFSDNNYNLPNNSKNNLFDYRLVLCLFFILSLLLLYFFINSHIFIFFKSDFQDFLQILAKEFNFTFFLNFNYEDFTKVFAAPQQGILIKINFILNYIFNNL
jgi:hypothetical protein